MPTSTVFCTKSECFGTEKYDNAVNCPQNPMRCGTLGSEKAKSKGVRRWGVLSPGGMNAFAHLRRILSY